MPQDKRFTPDSRFTLDERFTPDPTPTLNLPEPEPSFLSSVWNTISSPLTDLPSRIGRGISETITTPKLDESRPWAMAKGFGAGAIEGIGDLISGLSSPVNLATAALTGGSSMAAKAGLPQIAKLATMGARATAVPGAIHGAGTVLDPESTLGERGIGLTELAGNLAGMGQRVPSTRGQITPDVVPPQTDIAPMPTGFFDRMPPEAPPKPTMETAPMGQTIIIRKEGATPEIVKKAQAAGFVFQDLNDQGNFRFKKLNEPVLPETQPILEGEIGEARPTTAGIKHQLGPVTDVKRESVLAEAFNLPRGLMAAVDFSAPLRQGIALIHKPEFWKSVKPMFKAWASEENFRASQNEISQRPLFRERPNPKDPAKPLPSFADDAGLKLTDLTNLSRREEAIMSTWAEKVPGVRRSNRAYTAFLNNLRADVFESLVKEGQIFGADAKANLPLAREIANFVNTASGRGSLGKLESSAVALNSLLFSPRLIASRVQMLNPQYYIMANPMVRKEAIKSLFAIAAAGNTITQLGKMAGGTVSGDPTSSDFGKLKIGNTRLDPYGGFQQYIVLASRLLSGKSTSSTSGKEYNIYSPEGPYDPSAADTLARFGRGKLHPVLGFAYSLLAGGKEMSGEEMNLTTMNPMQNAVAQRFIPILLQDFYELAQSDELTPELKALIGTLSTFGMGSQTYGQPNQ